jgi:hypothetical protein
MRRPLIRLRHLLPEYREKDVWRSLVMERKLLNAALSLYSGRG